MATPQTDHAARAAQLAAWTALWRRLLAPPTESAQPPMPVTGQPNEHPAEAPDGRR